MSEPLNIEQLEAMTPAERTEAIRKSIVRDLSELPPGMLAKIEYEASVLAGQERCHSIVGTVWTGPMYCGARAKRMDANGRPLCGRKHRSNEGTLWFGKDRRYPGGTAGRWEFQTGPKREQSR